MSRVTLPYLVCVCCIINGCSDDGGLIVDGALPETGMDRGSETVAPEASAPDRGPAADASSPCNPALSLQPLTLDPTYCVTHRFEVPAKTDAFTVRGDGVYLFSMTGKLGQVQQATIDPQSGVPGSYGTLFSFTSTRTGTLFPGEYVALSPGAFVAVGYTEKDTLDGEILWGDKGIKTPKAVDKATGNLDVVFLDDTTMLVNGTGVGAAQDGQGVYLVQEGKSPRQLIKDMGIFSGFMALGPQVLFAGGYFASGNRVYGFTLAEVQAAITAGGTLSSADGDLVAEGNTSDITALDGDLVLTTLDPSYQFKTVQRLPVTVSGSTVTVGQGVDLVTGSGAAVTRLAATGKRLALLVQGSKPELVLLEQK